VRHGREVVVTYELANRGAFPLTLLTIRGPEGTRAEARQPVRLGGKDSGTGSARLTITLHVTSCAEFRRIAEADVPGLAVRAKNPYLVGWALLDLTDYNGDDEPGVPPPPPDPLDLLTQVCSRS
jgi:hypothetical protein